MFSRKIFFQRKLLPRKTTFITGTFKKYVTLIKPNGSVANRCPFVVTTNGQRLVTEPFGFIRVTYFLNGS